MPEPVSKLEASRREGLYQVDEQRAAILDAAELLFLRKGLEKTSMSDVAAQAGIARMSLYRYFPNRDVIALEIQKRMLSKIHAYLQPGDLDNPRQALRKIAQAMIRNFAALRDAYRYIGMFDHIYLDNPPGTALTEWTKNQLVTMLWGGFSLEDLRRDSLSGNQLVMAVSTVIWFLEKLALRGELTWSDQSVPLEEHLKLFEEMVMGYIDQKIDSEASVKNNPF